MRHKKFTNLNFSILNPRSSIFNHRPGFTLVETIIYIALLSLITSFIMVIFYQMLGGRDQHRNRVEVDDEANFMMQKIVWALTGASAINEPAVNATGSVLSLNRFNYGQNPIVFDRGANNLRIAKASGTAALLGSSRVFVDEFTVEHLSAIQSAPEGIKITLKVSSADITRPKASTTLVNTIYLR